LAMQRALPVELRISQGEFIGRPSILYLQVNEQREIRVGGEVFELGRGAIDF
jgi:trans-2,3-dihydro-3-hydroxyanthranilate isomerase